MANEKWIWSIDQYLAEVGHPCAGTVCLLYRVFILSLKFVCFSASASYCMSCKIQRTPDKNAIKTHFVFQIIKQIKS